MSEDQLKPTDAEVVRAYAAGARDKLADIAFTQAVIDLRKQWFGELMLDNLSDERIRELRAQLKALEAIPQRLASMARNDKFITKVAHGNR